MAALMPVQLMDTFESFAGRFMRLLPPNAYHVLFNADGLSFGGCGSDDESLISSSGITFLLSQVSFDLNKLSIMSLALQPSVAMLSNIVDVDSQDLVAMFDDDYSALGRAIFAICVLYGRASNLSSEAVVDMNFMKMVCGASLKLCIDPSMAQCISSVTGQHEHGAEVVKNVDLWKTLLSMTLYRGRRITEYDRYTNGNTQSPLIQVNNIPPPPSPPVLD